MNSVKVVEVGPRDGFQSIKEIIPTDIKIRVIDKIVEAGVKKIQVTSFVSPKAIPQMSDAAEVAKASIERHPEVEFFALVPNLRGAQNACTAGLKEISTVLSLSESHNKANVGCSVSESVERMRNIINEFPQMKISQDIATSFGCPFEGKKEIPPLLKLIERLKNIGFNEFTLCDTIGIAHPSQVETTMRAVKDEFPDAVFNVHIHDTRNMGMLNSYIAAQAGASAIQAALGGLGGCPFVPGASGNTSSEDLVNMLNSEGVDTGIDTEKLVEAARFMKKYVDGNYSGHLINVRGNQCS